MDDQGNDDESLTHRVEQLQRERDDLRKDIEQLCLQQAGPSYLAVATRMHFQRTASLEQEIESLKVKLARLTREKQNLQEELSETYRIKTQVADLHSAEVLKSKEAEKQVKFFQSCVASAFAERDHSLMESEKAKEREEAMSQKLIDSENRLAELQSAFHNEKMLNASLQIELRELKEQTESFEKVIIKFCEVRERDSECSTGKTWQDRCSCLLDDPSDKWVFNCDSITSTSKYIASLEEGRETLKNKINRLQNNMRMGLDIEQVLKRNVRSLEKKQILLDAMIRNGLSALREFHNQHKSEVMKIMEEETSQINSVIREIEKTVTQIYMNSERKFEGLETEACNDTECRDVHISSDIESSVLSKKSGVLTASSVSCTILDSQDALAQALKEKVAALLLLSQQEERHLLERDMSSALQKKIEELQNNLSQVTNEKVKVLLEFAQLKREYQLLLESHGLRRSNFSADGSGRNIIVPEREGRLKNILRGSYIRRWMGKDLGDLETTFHASTDESSPSGRKTYSPIEYARLKVEFAALQESMANMQHLISSVQRLRISLLKAREESMSAGIIETLSSILQEANHMKAALGSSLPIRWAADATDAATYESLYEPTETAEVSSSAKINPVSAAGFEMVELLILAAELLREHSQIQ